VKKTRYAITLMMLLSLAGCGGGSSSGSSSDEESLNDQETPEEPETNTSNLPPDPGPEGDATLEGIDSDDDGVRDDVQIAIYERYSDDETKRDALEQNAKALQEAIVAVAAEDSGAINQAAESVIDAVDCLHLRVSDPVSEIGFIEHEVVDTSERSKAYIKFNDSLNGRFFGGDDSVNPCQ